MCMLHMSPAHMPALLSHRTPVTKYNFEGKITKTLKMVTVEHTTQSWDSNRVLCGCTSHLPVNPALGLTQGIHHTVKSVWHHSWGLRSWIRVLQRNTPNLSTCHLCGGEPGKGWRSNSSLKAVWGSNSFPFGDLSLKAFNWQDEAPLHYGGNL